jgi:hypothetical protein
MKCVFCKKEAPLTREHVLPDWLKTLYLPKTKVINKFTGVRLTKPWLSNIFQHKAKIVCKDCNSGWMSDLELKTIPIIKQMVNLKTMKLTQSEQEILAFWAQKTILMINQAIPGGLKISDDLFEDLYLNKKASKKVMVDLGWRMNFKGENREPIGSFELKQIMSVDVKKEIFQEIKNQSENGGFVWKAVLALGPIVFELIGHNLKVRLEITKPKNVLKTIRPYKEDYDWPFEWPIEAEGGLSVIKARN